jgi:cytidylate kinase
VQRIRRCCSLIAGLSSVQKGRAGRDIGTVVCPDAAVRFYAIAAAETRAFRRFKEVRSSGMIISGEAVRAEMHEPNERDAVCARQAR